MFLVLISLYFILLLLHREVTPRVVGRGRQRCRRVRPGADTRLSKSRIYPIRSTREDFGSCVLMLSNHYLR